MQEEECYRFQEMTKEYQPYNDRQHVNIKKMRTTFEYLSSVVCMCLCVCVLGKWYIYTYTTFNHVVRY